MVFFYRRFLPLDVFIYAFGAENDASSSNLPSPFTELRGCLKLYLRQPREVKSGKICKILTVRFDRQFFNEWMGAGILPPRLINASQDFCLTGIMGA